MGKLRFLLPSQNLHKSRYFIVAWKKFRWAKNGHKFSKKGQFLPHYETSHLTLGKYRKIEALDNFDFVKCVPACPLCTLGRTGGLGGNWVQGQRKLMIEICFLILWKHVIELSTNK